MLGYNGTHPTWKHPSLRPHGSMVSHINPWAHPRETSWVSGWKSYQCEAAGGLCNSRDNQQRGKPAGQRWRCLDHSSGPSSLGKFGKKHEGLLLVRFESSTNKGLKSLKEAFPEQRKTPTALYSCVSLMSCFILWSAVLSFLWTCVWPASVATAGEEGQQDHEHTYQHVVIP